MPIVSSCHGLGEGAVWTVQHQGCGQRGLVLRAEMDFFSGGQDDIMTHHKKGRRLLRALYNYDLILLLYKGICQPFMTPYVKIIEFIRPKT